MNFNNKIVRIIFATSIGMALSTSAVFATNIGTNVSTNNLTVGGVLQIPTGAVLNAILSSDALGNAAWTTLANIKTNLALNNVQNVDQTNAANITSGTLADGRLSVNVTLAGNIFNGISQLVKLDGTGKLPAIDGSALTNINAASATTATNLAGGATGSVPYQTAANTTGFLGIGSAGQLAVVNAGATAPSWVTMSGDATISSAGAVTIPKDYGMFYGLTAGIGNAGPTDYAATIASGAPVPFPRSGPASGGVLPFTPTQFFIGTPGNYEVNFSVHTDEPGQLILLMGGIEQPQCLGDHGAGTGAIIGNCIITVPGATFVQVNNPAGNVPALTVSPANGASTRANAATLVIKKL